MRTDLLTGLEAADCKLGLRTNCPKNHGVTMIRLTRLDGEAFILNADLIKYVEQRPDTFITLTSNDRLVVGESPDEVLERAIDYQRNKRLLPDSCNN